MYANELGFTSLLSFGGAYSNHIHALAAAGQAYGIATVGIIRGDELSPQSNKTLAEAQKWGMQLYFVSRQEYTEKEALAVKFGTHKSLIIPEGGTNAYALQGVGELRAEIDGQIDASHICVALGTGGTFVGLLKTRDTAQVRAYPTIKGFKPDLSQFPFSAMPFEANWALGITAQNRRYGKIDEALINFQKHFEDSFGIDLDPIYTARLFESVFWEIEQGLFPAGSRIVVLHSGGLQGRH